MTNQERLLAFFEAENSRNWETYRRFLHDNVIWTLHSETEKQICGIDAYMDAMKAAYHGNEDTFICEKLYADKSENRFVTILMNNHGRRSCDVFDFKDGVIYREYEFIL